MLTLYTLPSSRSSRAAIAHLTDMDVPFVIQPLYFHRLSFTQLKEILYYTTDGVDEIIANGTDKKYLQEQGVDFNEITLSEFHYYLTLYPKLLKGPIAIGDDRMVVGYEEERYATFKPRSERLRTFSEKLNEIRKNEDAKLKFGEEEEAVYTI